jgi:hypothetical protein
LDESTSEPDGISAAQFHRAPGVSDWRVTATGPQAVFTAGSLAQAATLVSLAVAAAERYGILPDIDVRPEAAVVRVPYHSPGGIPAAATEFAAAVSAAARELGLIADPSLAQSIGIYVAQHSEADVRPFFTAALGYEAFGDTDAIDPLRCGPQLAFNPITGDIPSRGRTHLDVFVPADQGPGAGGCRARRGRQTRRRLVRSRILVARVAGQPRCGHRVVDGYLGLTPTPAGPRRGRLPSRSTSAA